MRRARLLPGVFILLLLARAQAQAPVTWDELSEPLPTYAYILVPGITPQHLATNVEGFTLNHLEIADYGRMLRARGLTLKREETIARTEHDYATNRKLLLMEIAWLQDAVEHALKPGTLKPDAVDRWITEPGRGALGTRRPVESDFKLKEREGAESRRGEDAPLKPGELEFGSGKR